MKTKPRIFKALKTMITAFAVTLVFGNLAMGQLNSNINISEELKNLDRILSEIKWDNESNYLLYPVSGTLSTQIEDIQDIEIWMVDVSCWNSNTSKEMKEVFCAEEIEYTYGIENWMLECFSKNTEPDFEPDNENEYHVESWMYNIP